MDAATFVDEFLTSIENIPDEIHHIFEEMTERETGFQGRQGGRGSSFIRER